MAFAATDDVATRLGRALTTAEEGMVELVLDSVTSLIAEAVDRDDAWADDLDPVPMTLRVICIEKAVGIAANPTALVSASEQLGAYQHSQTYARMTSPAPILLSDEERRRARRAVYGLNTASPRVPSIADDIFPLVIDPVTGWIE